MKNLLITLAIIALLIWRFLDGSTTSSGSYPERPIQVVVPYPQGGGSDNFARLLGRAIDDENLLDQPLVVLNQPGGSGTIGSRFVKDARPDGYRILCHHESMITAQLSGAVAFGPDDFELIARTGGIVLMIVVREDAPYQTVTDLLQAAKAAPNTVRFGANTGSPAHFTAMKLEAALPGAKFNLVTAGGGQTRYISLIGGHLEAGIFSLAEYLSFFSPDGTPPDKNIRALAVLSEKPHPDFPDVSTCVEQGIDVTSSNSYYWWAPQGTPAEVTEKLATAFQQAMRNSTVLQQLKEWSLGDEFTTGKALDQHIARRKAALTPPQIEDRLTLPNFPLYATILVIALGTIAIRKPHSAPLQTTAAKGWGTLAILIAYILILQLAWIPFFLTTAIMIYLIGSLISDWTRENQLAIIQIALLTGLASEQIFTQFFAVSLP